MKRMLLCGLLLFTLSGPSGAQYATSRAEAVFEGMIFVFEEQR